LIVVDEDPNVNEGFQEEQMIDQGEEQYPFKKQYHVKNREYIVTTKIMMEKEDQLLEEGSKRHYNYGLKGMFKPTYSRVLITISLLLLSILVMGTADYLSIHDYREPAFLTLFGLFLLWPFWVFDYGLGLNNDHLEFIIDVIWLYFLSCAIVLRKTRIHRMKASKND